MKKEDCSHYWLIASNDGLESEGECKLCHEKRTFPNIISYNYRVGVPWSPQVIARGTVQSNWGKAWSVK